MPTSHLHVWILLQYHESSFYLSLFRADCLVHINYAVFLINNKDTASALQQYRLFQRKMEKEVQAPDEEVWILDVLFYHVYFNYQKQSYIE